jgi:hypothetical protein
MDYGIRPLPMHVCKEGKILMHHHLFINPPVTRPLRQTAIKTASQARAKYIQPFSPFSEY